MGPAPQVRHSHIVALAAALAAVIAAPAAQAYTFGEPSVRQFGPEVQVYDWSTQKCNNDDIPDQATRAFRDVNDQVVLVNSHHTTRRYQGPTLATVTHNCSIMMGSGKNPDPSMFDDREWLATTWTPEGATVYGLIHSEYQGYNHEPEGFCIRSGEQFSEKQKCWYNTLTLTKSTNNGATFQHATPPNHFVAGPAYQYARGIGPIGYFQPSNIVRGRDGYLYLLSHVQDYGVQPVGSCLMRTNNIDDPGSWRLWDGSGFRRRSLDPYRNVISDPAQHVCAPVSPHIGTMSETLTWNTYFKKWVLVGSWQGPGAAPYPDSGFYYFTSDDLVNWALPKLLMKARLPWTWRCSDGIPEQVRDPSLLDNDSQSRNFDTTGQRPYIYFTRFNISGCFTSLDRDLIRIPIEFSNQQPGGPAAAVAASSAAPQPGERVTFDASRSADRDGKITAFKWDLDGNGTYERDTGTNPVTSREYTDQRRVTVTVRVCDDDGKATDETVVLDVGAARLAEPVAQPGAGAPDGDCPAPAGGASEASGPAGAAATTDGVPTIGRFRVIGRLLARRNGSFVLRVEIPSAGVLAVRGVGAAPRIRSSRLHSGRPGIVNLTVRPSKGGKKLLRSMQRVRAKARLVFTPVGGPAQRSTRTLKLRRAPVR
jgi:hypothetical protein